MSDCKTSLQQLEKLDLRQWRGLPASCTVADVIAVFPAQSENRGLFRLGSDMRSAEFQMLQLGDDDTLQMWLVDDLVQLLEIEDPKLVGGVDGLLSALGKPEATLEFAWDVLTLAGELAWPSRGITLFVNPDNQIALRVVVYRPTTLETYKRTLRVDRSVREFEPD